MTAGKHQHQESAMRERPILFSAPMIQALRAGQKTQTRRIVNPQPPLETGQVLTGWYHPTVIDRRGEGQPGPKTYGAWTADGEWGVRCPYGQPGHKLWVREAFAVVPRTAYCCSEGVQQTLRPDDDHDAAIYREGWTRSRGGFRWRPSIHMPRWASRITLEIVSVRVERLQDISEADARAEGCRRLPLQDGPSAWWTADVDAGPRLHGHSPRVAYQKLWDDINGRGSWNANPFVWVVSFRRI